MCGKSIVDVVDRVDERIKPRAALRGWVFMPELDRESAKIDLLVAKVEQAIECLQEYRTALITAAVTGKIDVRQQHSGQSGLSGPGGREKKAESGPAQMGVHA